MGDARNFSKALRSATACAAAVYALVVRPRISRWGATDDEVHRPLPGDELESPYGYRPVSTRAITIDAPPEESSCSRRAWSCAPTVTRYSAPSG